MVKNQKTQGRRGTFSRLGLRILLGFFVSISASVMAQGVGTENENLQRWQQRSSGVLGQAQQVFSESWRLMLGTNVGAGNSLLKAGAKHWLEAHPQSSPNSMNSRGQASVCRPGTWQENVRQEGQVLRWEKSLCGAQAGVAAAHMEMKWSTLGKMPGKSRGGEAGATFEWSVQPAVFAEAVGDPVAMLNHPVVCRGSVNQDWVLQEISCEGLAQGITRSLHIQFSQFHYQSSGNPQLVVEADRFENLMTRTLCDSNDPCLRLRAPLAGVIKIVEDHRDTKALAAAKVVPVFAAPKALPAKVEKSVSEPANDDKNAGLAQQDNNNEKEPSNGNDNFPQQLSYEAAVRIQNDQVAQEASREALVNEQNQQILENQKDSSGGQPQESIEGQKAQQKIGETSVGSENNDKTNVPQSQDQPSATAPADSAELGSNDARFPSSNDIRSELSAQPVPR